MTLREEGIEARPELWGHQQPGLAPPQASVGQPETRGLGLLAFLEGAQHPSEGPVVTDGTRWGLLTR